MSLTRSRPSPAMIVAVLALTLALAGSAIAAPDASLTALSKAQVKRIAKKVANKQITRRAPGLSVSHAKTADSATTATTAGNAEKLDGFEGADLDEPKARAVVENSPVGFRPEYPVKGFTAVTRPATGVYCLTPAAGVNPASDPAIVTVEWGTSSGFDLLAYWEQGADTSGCPAGDYTVRTYDFAAGGAPVPSNDVAFLINVL